MRPNYCYVEYGKATQSFHVRTNDFATTKSLSVRLKHLILECGPMPNLMVALPNIGGALCSTPQRLPDAHY